jgi:hypothetical protein
MGNQSEAAVTCGKPTRPKAKRDESWKGKASLQPYRKFVGSFRKATELGSVSGNQSSLAASSAPATPARPFAGQRS